MEQTPTPTPQNRTFMSEARRRFVWLKVMTGQLSRFAGMNNLRGISVITPSCCFRAMDFFYFYVGILLWK